MSKVIVISMSSSIQYLQGESVKKNRMKLSTPCKLFCSRTPNTACSTGDDGHATRLDDGVQVISNGHVVWSVIRYARESRAQRGAIATGVIRFR